MVRVQIKFRQDKIQEIDIKGHANSGEHGFDLVCAGISCISVGILNALQQLSENTCILEMKEGHVFIKVIVDTCEKTQVILQTLYIQLLTIEESNNQYIKISKEEV